MHSMREAMKQNTKRSMQEKVHKPTKTYCYDVTNSIHKTLSKIAKSISAVYNFCSGKIHFSLYKTSFKPDWYALVQDLSPNETFISWQAG